MAFGEQLACARAEARAAFERHCTDVRAKMRCELPGLLPRATLPGLEEAILLHRCRHAAARAFERRRVVRNFCACSEKLGHGELPVGALWVARMERVCAVKVAGEEVVSGTSTKKDVCADTSRLPKWLRDIRAIKYAAFVATRKDDGDGCPKEKSSTEAVETTNCQSVSEKLMESKCSAPIRDTRGYAQYVARAAAAHAAGASCATQKKSTNTAELDDATTMVRRYRGMPDELYRRRHGRAFARWRRQQREADAVARAEAEMARRRGSDRLHTQRSETDARPFAFDGGEHAYAYNTRITEAPRLRAQMVRKYASPAPQPLVPGLQGREKALQFADSAPMFHTRVMDRFRR